LCAKKEPSQQHRTFSLPLCFLLHFTHVVRVKPQTTFKGEVLGEMSYVHENDGECSEDDDDGLERSIEEEEEEEEEEEDAGYQAHVESMSRATDKELRRCQSDPFMYENGTHLSDTSDADSDAPDDADHHCFMCYEEPTTRRMSASTRFSKKSKKCRRRTRNPLHTDTKGHYQRANSDEMLKKKSSVIPAEDVGDFAETKDMPSGADPFNEAVSLSRNESERSILCHESDDEDPELSCTGRKLSSTELHTSTLLSARKPHPDAFFECPLCIEKLRESGITCPSVPSTETSKTILTKTSQKSGYKFYSCSERHWYCCNECAVGYLKEFLSSESFMLLRCPYESCSKFLDYDRFKELKDCDDMVSRMVDLIVRRFCAPVESSRIANLMLGGSDGGDGHYYHWEIPKKRPDVVVKDVLPAYRTTIGETGEGSKPVVGCAFCLEKIEDCPHHPRHHPHHPICTCEDSDDGSSILRFFRGFFNSSRSKEFCQLKCHEYVEKVIQREKNHIEKYGMPPQLVVVASKTEWCTCHCVIVFDGGCPYIECKACGFTFRR
jgi:hypothetical protein